jgi:Xaa-Pro aminopeptidase
MNAAAITVILALVLTLPATLSPAQDYGVPAVRDQQNILPLRKRVEVVNNILRWRLDNLIPTLMRSEGIDMWLIINRGEYHPDPIYWTMVPEPRISGGRHLIFYDRGGEGGVERLVASTGAMGEWYGAAYTERKEDPFESLADFIRERNPRKIGINTSEHLYWSFADGITATYKKKLEQALGSELSSKLVSAEKLCIRWLETRSPHELSVYRHICGIAHDIIAELYSNKVITPDITTLDDAAWWIRQRISDLGLRPWFQPYLTVERAEKEAERYGKDDRVVRRGDLLHCDVGLVYLGLSTDTQQNAYVLREGEEDAPEGLKEALRRANRVQDILMARFQEGRSGNEILLSSLQQAKSEGLKPSIYCHPVGNHGHAAGPLIGLYRRQEALPVYGEYPLHLNTCHAIELNNMYEVPEWGNQAVRMALEEDAAFTEEGCRFIDGRQTKLYIIK